MHGRFHRLRNIPLSFVAFASLGLLTAWAAYQITDDRIDFHCASQSCVDRYLTGRAVFLTATFVLPALALLLIIISTKERQFWSRVGWALFASALIAIIAYGIWVNLPNENVTL